MEVLAISNDRTVEVWRAGVERLNMQIWPNIIIGRGGATDFVSIFNVQGFPTKILLNPEGRIVLRESGKNEDLFRRIEEIITK